MKKKALTVLLSLCVAMTMTACGGNADTTEVEETTVVAESTEVDAQIKEEAEAEAEEVIAPEQTDDEASVDEESSGEMEIDSNDSVREEEFPVMGEKAMAADKSDEYGVYSTSCYDVDQFLDEDNNLIWVFDFEGKEQTEYSGRFAYPKIIPNTFITDVIIDERTDAVERVSARVAETEVPIAITMFGGSFEYESYCDQIGYALDKEIGYAEMWPAVQLTDGECEVLHYYRLSENLNMHWYIYQLGNFSIEIICYTEEGLTSEEVQTIADNIQLTDGTE